MKYGLSEKQLEEIVDFIAQYPKVETAVLFGSRALGTYKEASDVDIALHGEKVNHSLAAKMKFNIEEDTYLPFMFDFVAYPTITNDALRKHIDTKGVVIFRRGGGDTLLARITPCLENGKAAFVMFIEPGEVGWGSTEYIVMRPKELLHPFFAYTLSRNRDFRDYAESCMEGSIGWQRVNVDHLKNYEMKTPSLEAVNEFNAFAESTVQKLRMNSNQIHTLEKLRDTLLPKLMSGEVRVAV